MHCACMHIANGDSLRACSEVPLPPIPLEKAVWLGGREDENVKESFADARPPMQSTTFATNPNRPADMHVYNQKEKSGTGSCRPEGFKKEPAP